MTDPDRSWCVTMQSQYVGPRTTHTGSLKYCRRIIRRAPVRRWRTFRLRKREATVYFSEERNDQ